MNPKILFFDEPTSALDPQLTGEILKVIKDLAAEHMTMVIVTHEMNFARNVADHIVFKWRDRERRSTGRTVYIGQSANQRISWKVPGLKRILTQKQAERKRNFSVCFLQ